MKKINIKTIQSWKGKRAFSVITAYDYTSAKIIDRSNIPIILVGDSASMITYGYTTTVPITMDEILLVSKAVSRAANNTFVVGDMPFLSYQASSSSAINNAGKLLKMGGVEAVKLEGGVEVSKQIKKIVASGIPVMGHVGLTPQSVNLLSGHNVQGKTIKSAQKILDDALCVEDSGAFAVVLECIPKELAALITNKLSIPTIGIGSGTDCDGQVQVFHDILGMIDGFNPKHAKKYSSLSKDIKKAIDLYDNEVVGRKFPSFKNSTSVSKKIIESLK